MLKNELKNGRSHLQAMAALQYEFELYAEVIHKATVELILKDASL